MYTNMAAGTSRENRELSHWSECIRTSDNTAIQLPQNNHLPLGPIYSESSRTLAYRLPPQRLHSPWNILDTTGRMIPLSLYILYTWGSEVSLHRQTLKSTRCHSFQQQKMHSRLQVEGRVFCASYGELIARNRLLWTGAPARKRTVLGNRSRR